MATTMNPGDRVKTMRDIHYGRIPAGTVGTVVEKYTPHWATGCWTITVQFDGDSGWTRLPYPDGTLELVEECNLPTAKSMGYTILAPARQAQFPAASCDYSADCPACLRGRAHGQAEHDAILARVYAANRP